MAHPLSGLKSLLLVVALVMGLTREAVPRPGMVESMSSAAFDAETVECALALASTLPGAAPHAFQFWWVSQEQKSFFAKTNAGPWTDPVTGQTGNGAWVYIYAGTFGAAFKDLVAFGFDTPFACAVLSVTLFHESLHHCYGITHPAGKYVNSCLHASIAYASHKAACDEAAALIPQIEDLYQDIAATSDPAEEEALKDQLDELEERRIGLCVAAEKIRKLWSRPKYARKMALCANGTASNPFTPPPNCAGGYPPVPDPPAPTSSGYPNNDPFAGSCPGCEGVL